MGNASVKQQDLQNFQYQQYMSDNATDKLDLASLDPYKVLNVPKNFTWLQLKDAYRETALKTHPDKGGNKTVFDFVTSCFKTLAEEYKARNANKSHHDLKKDSNEYFDKIINTEMPHPSIGIMKNEPFEKRFNKVFDECRYQDDNNIFGYGDFMDKSTSNRDDINVQNVFNKSKVDNSTFNEVFNKKVPVSKEIVKYKEPEPLIMAKALKFTEIGAKRTDDYSSSIENRDLAYTDYMKAHSGVRLVNPDAIKNRKDFRSVEEYEKYRDNKTKRGLTEKEKKYMEQKKKREDEEEFNRLERIKEQNMAINKAYEKANRLMLR
jgi:curved DNA-binding protein CbpA